MIDRIALLALKNSNTFARLEREIEKSIAQSFLITSEDTLSLDALVTLFECKTYCRDVCFTCVECKRVLTKNKVDVFEINPEGEKISIDDLREKVISDAYVSSMEGGKKIYVIRNFSAQSANVQNGLLKTLEEPPENVIMLLTSPSTEGILPTVLSRVNKYVLPPFSFSKLTSILQDEGVANAEETAKCAAGNLTMAMKISKNENFLEKILVAADMLLDVKKSEHVPKYLGNKFFEDMTEALFIIKSVFRDLLYVIADLEDNISLSILKDRYAYLAEEFDKNALASLMEEVNEAERRVAANCNKTNIIDHLLLRLAEEKTKCKK